MRKSSPCTSPSGWCSLGGEGQDHPADDKVEEEDGVHDERLAVGGLAVRQERRGCCRDTKHEQEQQNPHSPHCREQSAVRICNCAIAISTAIVLTKKALLKPTGCNHQIPLSYRMTGHRIMESLHGLAWKDIQFHPCHRDTFH